MLYFYEYKFKNGSIVGGHNLQTIEFYDNFIKLSGVDEIPGIYWGTLLDMKEIEYLKIIPMKDEVYNYDS